jgi:hypothetical protein
MYKILILLIFSCTSAIAQNTGILKGKIIDEETQAPVEDALIEILNTGLKQNSDVNGEFIFDKLELNTYQIRISAIGYNPIIKSDLVINASRPFEISVILNPKGITTSSIDVKANYFQKSSDVNTSSINLDFEEIRRQPGATEDISRMVQTIPGVSIGNDQRNDIIVRGGSPSENLLLIDGIDIPNINHFGTQGSTSGAIGFINVKLIQETDILTGGFPSLYGDRLSGVVDIKFREGSRKQFFNDVFLSIAGFGGLFEGPIGKKGSYMFSARRSYLELLKSAIRLTSVPNYWDFNLKASYDIGKEQKLSLIGLAGLDKIAFSSETEDDNPYGRSDAHQNTFALGLNYKKLFKKGFLQTVLSNSFANHDITSRDTQDSIEFKSKAYEDEIILKTDLNYQLTKSLTLNTGIGGKYILLDNNIFLRADTSYSGYAYDAINSKMNLKTFKLFSHINFSQKLFKDALNINAGIR